MESVRSAGKKDTLHVDYHEYVVLGAGPAGLQAAYYLERDGRDYLVLEAGEGAGTFFKTFPRHRRLISINRTHYVGHLRACNNNLLDTYQLKSQNTILDADVTGIRRGEKGLLVDVAYRHADGQCITLAVDRVIHCTGFRCDTSIFDNSCKPELVFDGKLPAVTSEWESTSVPDLFFAGALMQARDYQKAFSAFIHGFRYNVKALCRMLARRYHGVAKVAEMAVDAPA